STFDALSAVDHLVASGESARAVVAPLRRLLNEFLLWRRTDPQVIRFTDEWLAPQDSNLPHFRPPDRLQQLNVEAVEVEENSVTISRLVLSVDYGPTGQQTDRAVELAAETLDRAASLAETFVELVRDGVEVNRGWLARNAGRNLVTSGDLTDFLM